MRGTLPLIILLICLFIVFPAFAQTGVYVTTQDFVSLRTGPMREFERLDVIPPVVTLPAVGRSADMQWIQVDYEGVIGWISAEYLVWSGDIIQLPVDGVNPGIFIRRAIASGVTVRETPIYRSNIDPSDQVGTIPADTEVEIVGRLGSGRFFWLQIRYEGESYWVGTWDINQTGGSYDNLADAGYRFPYGRLLNQLREDVTISLNSLATIESIWARLGSAQAVSCESTPPYAVRVAVDNDVAREPIFAPVAEALDAAVTDINSAISTFEDACLLPDDQEAITDQDVRDALRQLDSARRSLTLASALLNSLRNHNPLLAGFEE